MTPKTPQELREAEQSARLAEIRRVLADRLWFAVGLVGGLGLAVGLVAAALR